MKSFFWRFVFCFVPVLLATWVIADAWPDKFKWGVDLNGGTILVYEIDTRKLEKKLEAEEAKSTAAEESTVDYFKRTASELSSALRRRIDPTGTYNIVVRPAGSEGRVEIILPTGSAKQAEKAEAAWQKLLANLKEKYKATNIDVPRGQVSLLVERIQTQLARKAWKKELLNSSDAWARMLMKLMDITDRKDWDRIDKKLADVGASMSWDQFFDVLRQIRKKRLEQEIEEKGWPSSLGTLPAENVGSLVGGLATTLNTALALPSSAYAAGAEGPPIVRLRQVQVGNVDGLTDELVFALLDVTRQEIAGRIREFTWEELIYRLVNWPELDKALRTKLEPKYKKLANEDSKKFDEIIEKEKQRLHKALLLVPVDSFEELVGRIENMGNVVAQAVLDTVEPLIGRPDGMPVLISGRKVEERVTKLYGPSFNSIKSYIDDFIQNDPDLQASAKYLTSEEVQRIKDLIAKVGALEFLILANEKDDIAAINEMKDWFEDRNNQDELEKLALEGLPPPGPRVKGTKELKKYEITTANNSKSIVSYRWVEIGKQERRLLGFNNGARTDPHPSRREIWEAMASLRAQGKAGQIVYPGKTTKLWQGALFYSRECKNRNLPEKERREKKYEYFVLARNPEYDPATGEQTPAITGRYLSRAHVDTHTGRPQVAFSFYPEGADLFRKLTSKNVPSGEGADQVKRHLAIVLDGFIMSAPTINSTIGANGVITGDFTMKDVKELVTILRSGALPATLKPMPVSESTIGSLLGQDTINQGKWAIIWSLIIVIVFMAVYYRFAGIVACIALTADLVLTIGFMVFVKATFTLPGLAGLVLMLGMAVDAIVLIYERIREERDRGASLPLALRNGYERAFPTIMDTHLTSIFTAVVLYSVGTDQLKGFAISLTVGLIISLFTAMYMTRVFFDYALDRGWLKKMRMMRLLTNPGIDFMRYRKAMFPISVTITLLGLALFLGRLPRDLGIDLRGGTSFSAQLKKPVSIQDMRDYLSEPRQKELLKVAKVEQVDEDGRQFKIWYEGRKQPYDVNFVNDPVGREASKEENEKAVTQRASVLPDWDVLMLYPSSLLSKMKAELEKARAEKNSSFVSPFFTVRTAEMERELVQIVLDRLLQEKQGDQWVSMIRKVLMTEFNTTGLSGQKNKTIRLEFSGPASPSYVKSLLEREFRVVFPVNPKTKKLPFRYQVLGEGQADESGRYKTMIVSFEGISEADRDGLVKAVEAAQVAFNGMPQPLRLENFDPELASDMRFRALAAVFVSWLAIILYLWFRFGNWTFGLSAVLCLIHDLCFTLGLVAVSAYLQPTFFGELLLIEDFKIDLTGVAALLTLVGYSVNDTIVVFDRIREVRGKNPELTPQIINESINQTLSRTVITSLTTFIVVVILYFIGGPGIHLFAFIMTAGVLIGTFSSIFIACPLLLILGEGRLSEKELRRREQEQAAGTF